MTFLNILIKTIHFFKFWSLLCFQDITIILTIIDTQISHFKLINLHRIIYSRLYSITIKKVS